MVVDEESSSDEVIVKNMYFSRSPTAAQDPLTCILLFSPPHFQPKSPSVLTVKVIRRDENHLPPPPVTLQSPTASLTDAVTEDIDPEEETDSVAPHSDAEEVVSLDDAER